MASVALMVILVMFLVHLGPRWSIAIPLSILGLGSMCLAVSAFAFTQNKLFVFFPFMWSSRMHNPHVGEAVKMSFHQNASARARVCPPRNVILIQVESMELSYIGKYNKRYPKSMPFLSSIADSQAHFTGFASQPYTAWTAAGLLVTQCGFPQVMPNVNYHIRAGQRLTLFARLPCVPDFLKRLGYHLMTYSTGSLGFMGVSSFLREHGYSIRDKWVHHANTDDALFNLLANSVLPSLRDRAQWPFCLLIMNEDTHVPFRLGKQCRDYLAQEDYPWVYRSFTCLDQHLERFMDAFHKLDFAKSTEVFIYADHLSMGNVAPVLGAERNLTLFVPLRPQDAKWQRGFRKPILTYYDLPPTILSLLGVEYDPPFPFGADVFGPHVGRYPSEEDLKLIYGIVTGDVEAKRAKCHEQSGFCRGSEY
jgi:phosphoglycerol transferase MdoB-like AlkP superfamily enzyme